MNISYAELNVDAGMLCIPTWSQNANVVAETRKSTLKETYLFTCECPRCTNEDDESVKTYPIINERSDWLVLVH